MPRRRWLTLLALCLPLLAAGPARGEAKTPLPLPEGTKLIVLHDGKKHYLAIDTEMSSELLFYGDGKSFYRQRVGAGGGERAEAGSKDAWVRRGMSFWDPRFTRGVESSFDLSPGGKWSVTCGEHTTALTRLPDEEAARLQAGAAFLPPRWTYRAHALARDSTGRYYYVDQAREPEGNKRFRLFSGPKGDLRPLKMINVVSDSKGEIFSTRSGELRLVLNKDDYAWVHGEHATKLLSVPVEDNHVMIYTDLGVYTGQRLGTPCDDLM